MIFNCKCTPYCIYAEIPNQELPSSDFLFQRKEIISSLKQMFESNPNPNLIEMLELATRIDCDVRKVKHWFHQKRQLKKKSRARVAKGIATKQLYIVMKML